MVDKVNTLVKWVLEVSTTIENSDLDQTAFEALTWTKVSLVTEISTFGATANITAVGTLERGYDLKSKGIRNAGDVDVTCVREESDAGQAALTSYADTNSSYGFKITTSDDTFTDSISPTIMYCRGGVDGPIYPGGDGNAADKILFKLLYEQEIIKVIRTETP